MIKRSKLQKKLISQLCGNNKESIIVSSLGTISYDLKEIDHPNKVLIKGAMGAALPCALGIALHTDKQVLCFVGDGSFLMKMGALATYMKHKPDNLRVIVINNNCYKSCGGQSTNFKYIKDLLPKEIEVYEISS